MYRVVDEVAVQEPQAHFSRFPFSLFETMGVFRCQKFLGKVSVALFVVIWQKLSNHGLTKLKRVVSTFTDKLCN
jgi:hypothetical protein